MPNLDLLGSVMRDLHQEFTRMYYMILPLFFALSIAVTWFKHPQGSVDFIDILKRAFVSTLLLVAFPDISSAIVTIADGIASRIDDLSGLETVVRMAKEKADGYSMSTTSILLQFNDLIIATLSFLSYLILYIARYITIAMYHFFWIFFTISAPLLLLFNLFQGTSQITVNLFKGMIEVASWKIVWAILSAMLTALSFGNAYRTEGNYLTLIVMNFVIALAMLATPLIVRSIVGQGFQSMSSTLGPAAVAAMVAAPAKVVTVAATTRNTLGGIQNASKNGFQSTRKNQNSNFNKGSQNEKRNKT
jgi:hypothetical protein